MIRSIGITVAVIAVSLCQVSGYVAGAADPVWVERAEWSRDAIEVPYSQEPKLVGIKAPNPQMAALLIEGTGFRVTAKGQPLVRTEDKGINRSLAEVLWSPDSSAFVITQSDGGGVGTWYTLAYSIEGTRLREIDVGRQVMKACAKTYKCDVPEDPNVGAVAWLEGSKQLLLVCEVPPHSNCGKMMGKLRGYVVNIASGKIVKELSGKKLKSDYGQYLGRRLR